MTKDQISNCKSLKELYTEAIKEIFNETIYIVASDDGKTRYKYTSLEQAKDGVMLFNELGVSDAKIYTEEEYFWKFPNTKTWY